MNIKRLSTKEEILTDLKRNGPISVSDLANNVGITEMAVRRHLNTLDRDDLIKVIVERQPMGRPTNLYSLTEKAEDYFPKNYKNFLKIVLDIIYKEKGDNAINDLILKIEEENRQTYQKKIGSFSCLKDKINSFVDLQSECGYMVEVDEYENEFRIKQYNCPIIAIAKEYNRLCESEKNLFSDIFKTEVELLHSISKGDKYCEFCFKKN